MGGGEPLDSRVGLWFFLACSLAYLWAVGYWWIEHDRTIISLQYTPTYNCGVASDDLKGERIKKGFIGSYSMPATSM